MKKLTAAVALAVALAVVPVATAGNTATLYPSSFGAFTTASWRAQIGLPDTVGSANQALLLQKDTTDPGTAATAVVRGVEGAAARTVVGLEWQRDERSDCTPTSPRWTLVVQGKARQYVVRFGCAESLHAPGAAPGWVRDFNSQALIQSRLVRAGRTDALNGTVVSLAIVFDERGQTGATILDNIRAIVKSAGIGVQTWTCAADNAQVLPGGAAQFAPDDLRVNPMADFELLAFDELWSTLAPEDQALVDTSESST